MFTLTCSAFHVNLRGLSVRKRYHKLINTRAVIVVEVYRVRWEWLAEKSVAPKAKRSFMPRAGRERENEKEKILDPRH